MTTMTRLRPFGARRKTYFYGVAGFVLAAHVVVGAIFHVMPPEDDGAGTIVPVEVQIVDHLIPDEVVESSAVKMIEEPEPEEEEELPIFTPVWEGSAVAPEPEPIGPTESVLPEVVVEETATVEAETVAKPKGPSVSPATEKKVATTPPPATKRKAATTLKKPPVKTKEPPVKSTKSAPPVKKPPVVKKAPEPEPEIQRAVPVPSSNGRTGMLNRLRSRSSSRAARSGSGPYVAAHWSKRPPPYYPHEAQKRGIEGTAHVRVSIDSRGKITAARITKSAGNSLLDRAALASVRKGVLNPATRGGRGVPSEMLVPFEFYLPE